MRKGLTLIELIFTMVIVAITFVVIPKLMQTYALTGRTVVKEDAIFNTITMMGLITHLAWDENNIENDSILSVTNNPDTNYKCGHDIIGYRKGGFAGGRNCSNLENIPIPKTKASTIKGTYTGNLNSIDSYNGYDLDTVTPCNGKLYDLGVKVSYYGKATSNVKRIEIRTRYDSAYKFYDKTKTVSQQPCVIFDYYAYNIGQVSIKKRRW